MDVKEKLVELLEPHMSGLACEYESGSCELTSCRSCNAKNIADNLITNGVTVQEWISVKDKLPPHNHDVLVYRPDMAMKILVDNYYGYYGEDDAEWHEGWAKYGKDIHNNPLITHWMPLPQPPKGE